MSVRISTGKKRLGQAGTAIDEMFSLRGLRLDLRGSSRQAVGWRPCLHCGGAGAPCPWCNKETPPRMADGFRTVFDLKGWRH
jgi:hypothetical protein